MRSHFLFAALVGIGFLLGVGCRFDAANKLGASCTSDDECRTYSCVEGFCGDEVIAPPTCGEDCDGFCDEAQNCVDCLDDGDCASGQCQEGVCGCIEDRECPEGVCSSQGECVQCVQNSDCDVGVCELGQCLAFCEEGSCPPGTYCDESTLCVPGCGGNSDCEQGECINNSCSESCVATGCELGSYCDEGAGVCVEGCRNEEDCSEAEICDDVCVNACTLLDCPAGCDEGTGECLGGCNQTDNRCPPGQFCQDEICFDGCANDADCLPGQFCAQGQVCEEVPANIRLERQSHFVVMHKEQGVTERVLNDDCQGDQALATFTHVALGNTLEGVSGALSGLGYACVGVEGEAGIGSFGINENDSDVFLVCEDRVITAILYDDRAFQSMSVECSSLDPVTNEFHDPQLESLFGNPNIAGTEIRCPLPNEALTAPTRILRGPLQTLVEVEFGCVGVFAAE